MKQKSKFPLFSYSNEWVAQNRRNHKVIASAKTAEQVVKKLEKMKIKQSDAVLTWVPPADKFLSL